jgi:hypothetical protein
VRARGGFVQVKFKTWVRTWPDWGPGPPSLRLALSPIHALSTSFPACSLSLHSGAGSGCLLGSHHKRKLYAKNALHTQCGGWAAKTAPHLCSSLVLFPTHDDRLGREWGRACLPACLSVQYIQRTCPQCRRKGNERCRPPLGGTISGRGLLRTMGDFSMKKFTVIVKEERG